MFLTKLKNNLRKFKVLISIVFAWDESHPTLAGAVDVVSAVLVFSRGPGADGRVAQYVFKTAVLNNMLCWQVIVNRSLKN